MKKENLNKIILVILLVLVMVFLGLWLKTRAADKGTALNVLNTPPTITAVQESVASYATTPTNEGDSITITASVTEPNQETWKLVICKDGDQATMSGDTPTCGVAGSWGASSSYAAYNASNSVTFSTSGISDQSKAWFAYACDDGGDGVGGFPGSCSTADDVQGSGDSGSPFVVNHRPSFTLFPTQTEDPSDTDNITFTTTASDADDSEAGDLDTDTISLFVCSTNSFTGGASPACGGSEICKDESGSDNPSCSTHMSIPTPDGDYPAYAFVVDSHGFVHTADITDKGGATGLTINNIAPSVGSFAINSSSSITLATNITTDVDFSFIVTDNNSCLQQDELTPEISSAIGKLYRSSASATCDDPTGTDAVGSYCYYTTTCSQDEAFDPCADTSDPTVGWTCTATLTHYADPTDVGSEFPDDKWGAYAVVVDDNSATHTITAAASGVQVELLQNAAGDIPVGDLDYGGMFQGDISGFNAESNLINQGNTGLDQSLSGTNMCSDYPTCSANTIAVGQQEYSYRGDFVHGGLYSIASLTTSAVSFGASGKYCRQPVDGSVNPERMVYWKIKVPDNQASGSYTGLNTVLYEVTSDPDRWDSDL